MPPEDDLCRLVYVPRYPGAKIKAEESTEDVVEMKVTHSATGQMCGCGWGIRASGSQKVVRWADRMFQKHVCDVADKDKP